MKYFKMYKEVDAKAFEITKEEARQCLDGWWDADALNEIFNDDKCFRLYTPFCEVWTNDNGKGPMAGFYGYSE